MKLLFVHERFGALGGAEANAQLTAAELKDRGHTVAILHGPGTGRSEEAWEKTFEIRFPLRDKGNDATAREALAAFKPDVVYVHKTPDLELLQALVSSGVPLVRMVHDHDIYCMRSYRYNYFTRRICQRAASPYCIFPCGASLVKNTGGGFPLRWVSYSAKKREIAINRQFDRMLVVTSYMREELIRNEFDPARIEVHPPIPRAGDPSIRSNFSDRNLILYLGQIIRGKGVDVLLKALARMRMPFECLILGDGNHRAYCERLSKKLGLADRVEFKGYVPHDQLKEYFRECSVVAISSVWPEPIATVGLEVMRYALPVVAFDAGGIRDWLADGENGYLVPWMDIDLYAGRLDALLQDKALAKSMGERGFEIVSEKFDYDGYIRGLEDLFARVSAEKRDAAISLNPSPAPRS